MTTLLSDPNVADAASLVAVYAARDVIVDRKLPKFSNAAALGVSQLVYNKFVKDMMLKTLTTATGDTVWSGILANSLGLAAVLYGLKKAGWASDIGASALIPTPSSMVAESIVEAAELLVEKRAAEYLVGMSGVKVPFIYQSQPQPAKVLNNGTI